MPSVRVAASGHWSSAATHILWTRCAGIAVWELDMALDANGTVNVYHLPTKTLAGR